MSKYWDYRANPYEAQPTDTGLFELPMGYRPLILWAMEGQKDKNDWRLGDESLGYQHVCKMQWELITMSATGDITEAINKLYRLVDASLNGASYTASPDPLNVGGFVISPPIPNAPQINIRTQPTGTDAALRRAIFDAQGVLNAGWFDIGGERTTLADVVEALRIGSPSEVERVTDTLDEVAQFLDAGSDGIQIFDAVRGLFTETAGLSAEAATLGTLIASGLANTAAQLLMAQKLDNVYIALTGSLASTDAVVPALRDIEDLLQ